MWRVVSWAGVAVGLMSANVMAGVPILQSIAAEDFAADEEDKEKSDSMLVMAPSPDHPLQRALEAAPGAEVEEEAPESAVSSPPMEMDDPGTPGSRGIELNLVGTLARAGSGHTTESLLDANYGIGDRIQLKYERPYLTEGDDGVPTQHGLGSTEIGVKWRFLERSGLEVAVYPQYSFDDGFTMKDEEGNPLENPGRSLYLPVLISKAIGAYTVAGNVGYNKLFDAEDEDINLAVGIGRSLGMNSRILTELFSERDGHLNNRQTDVRVGYVHTLFLSWLTGFSSLGHSIGTTEDGERSTSFVFGISMVKEPRAKP